MFTSLVQNSLIATVLFWSLSGTFALAEEALKSKEYPYPGASNEEFIAEPKQPVQTVIIETDSGNKEVAHPLARKGLKRILKDGTYVYGDAPEKQPSEKNHRFKKKGLKYIDSQGNYHYRKSKESDDVENHPHADKGLISKKGSEYSYKVKETPRTSTISFNFGTSTTPQFERTVSGKVINFEKIYKNSSMTQLTLTRDWSVFGLQSLKFSLAGGIVFAEGTGVFNDNPDNVAPEKYTLIILPVTTNFIYRAQFFSSQYLLPYFGGGPGIAGLIEERDDGKRGIRSYTPILQAVAGLGINMDLFNKKRMNSLDARSGINDIYLSIESRINQALDKDLDFSTAALALGFIVEY